MSVVVAENAVAAAGQADPEYCSLLPVKAASRRRGGRGKSLEKKRRISMELTERRAADARDQWRAALEKHKDDPAEDMGAMERRLLREGRELQRAELERILQEKANDTPANCPVCGAPLKAPQWREVEILSRFGPVTINRVYGRCPRCDQYFAPADHVLATDGEGKNSPEMADQLRLLGTIAPPEQAERLSEKLYGFRIDDSRIARELELGEREALEQRERDDERALSPEGRWEVTREIGEELPDEFVMIIQADGFMTRERDEWGKSDEIRAQGQKPERWHETKAATIFLLQDRVTCGGKTNRPVILRRARVATRRAAFGFGQMLYAEAVRQGLLLAKEVYFIADGAVWLWNIFDERLHGATGTLDSYHAFEHLWVVARARYGEGQEAEQWVRPLIHQLRHAGEAGVLRTLEELARTIEEIEPEQRDVDEETILREWQYFDRHRDHFDYASKAERGLPIGSGCIESTCKQYQLRVKRCGQFWSTENLEGLLCLYSQYLSHMWN